MRIPDITERFPEGMNGIDTLDTYDEEYELNSRADNSRIYEENLIGYINKKLKKHKLEMKNVRNGHVKIYRKTTTLRCSQKQLDSLTSEILKSGYICAYTVTYTDKKHNPNRNLKRVKERKQILKNRYVKNDSDVPF